MHEVSGVCVCVCVRAYVCVHACVHTCALVFAFIYVCEVARFLGPEVTDSCKLPCAGN